MTEQPKSPMGQLFALGVSASQLGFLVIGGLLGGNWLDKKWGTSPALALTGVTIGLVSGVWVLLRILKQRIP